MRVTSRARSLLCGRASRARTTGSRCRSARGPGSYMCPVIEMLGAFSGDGIDPAHWKPILALDPVHRVSRAPTAIRPPTPATSSLVAWDPVSARKAWQSADAGAAQRRHARDRRRCRVPGPRRRPAATRTRRATDARLWSFAAGTAVVGTPITFVVGRPPVRRDPRRSAARLGRWIRLDGRAIRLERT